MSFTWAAAADILLVAVVLYYFLRLVRDARAFPVLLVAVGLAGLYALSRWAQLETLGWLLSSPVSLAVAAGLVVVYQGEIRRGLVRLGSLPWLARLGGRQRGQPFDDIVLACSQLSRQRIGALMVLERQVSLGTYIESGIRLDARLSYDLLVSIFLPRSPLHDGAVIARRNRIVAASCFLPLSLNPLLSSALGTRHRAAIGVTEESDAVAVVVSEETGQISVMRGGSAEMNVTPEQLRDRLRRLMRAAAPRLPGGRGSESVT